MIRRSTFILDTLLRAEEKAVGLHHFLRSFTNELSTPEKVFAKEILWRVEERLRPALEEEGITNIKICEHIKEESKELFNRSDEVAEMLRSSGLRDERLEQVARMHVLYAAEWGREPASFEIEEMKNQVNAEGVLLDISEAQSDLNLTKNIRLENSVLSPPI